MAKPNTSSKPAGTDYPSAPKAVTFDFTRTLAHCPSAAEIYSETLSRHGIVADIDEIRLRLPIVWKEMASLGHPGRDRFSLFPNGSRGFWHRLLVQLCAEMDLQIPTRFASAELFDRFAHAEAWEVYPDVMPCLEGLRRSGTRLGIVSNWDERLPRLLELLGLGDFFDVVMFSQALGIEKPNPELFLVCLRQMEVDPGEATHIGDHPVEDVEGALAVGMNAAQIVRQLEESPPEAESTSGAVQGDTGQGDTERGDTAGIDPAGIDPVRVGNSLEDLLRPWLEPQPAMHRTSR